MYRDVHESIEQLGGRKNEKALRLKPNSVMLWKHVLVLPRAIDLIACCSLLNLSFPSLSFPYFCLLYTSDAADE